MIFAVRIVDRRCATTTVVRPMTIRSKAAWTRRSLAVSKAEVASSNNKILGFFKMALAIAMRCFWPPDIWVPRSPTWVSNFSGRRSIKTNALAACAAAKTSSRVAPGLPMAIFS
mmetsp:Transcript_13373/g.23681  ORF Transcript_13373/g.23681 Transcript_13373/m.23681 type:complete len:114 (+) Transcript_13373:3432-3773(+)